MLQLRRYLPDAVTPAEVLETLDVRKDVFDSRDDRKIVVHLSCSKTYEGSQRPLRWNAWAHQPRHDIWRKRC